MIGIVLAIAAALCWSTGAIFIRPGIQGIKASTATFISMLSSLLLVGSLALANGAAVALLLGTLALSIVLL